MVVKVNIRQTAHMEVLKPHAGTEEVNNQLFSEVPAFSQGRENV